jgi:hypothetical protein
MQLERFQQNTRNPFEKLKRKFLSDFLHLMNEWKEEGRITEKEATKVFRALDDDETQAYLDLFIQQNLLGLVFRAEFAAAIGAYIGGDVNGALIGEGIRAGLKNLHAQIIGRKIPVLKRQAVAAATMPTVIGAQTPLAFLHQKHPELYNYFRFYWHARKFYKLVQQQKINGPKDFTALQRLMLKRNFSGDTITPKNLPAVEEQVFEQFLIKYGIRQEVAQTQE